MFFLFIRLVRSLLPHHQDAEFIEQVERNGNDRKGKRVACGSDDGGYEYQQDKGMTTILAKE
jgi:hypothetical protein